MTHQIFNLPPQHPLSAAGRVLPGAKLSFFLTTTDTPTPVYTTSALSTTHTQPIEADAGGRFASIYLDPTINYKATVTDSNDVLLYTVDPVNDQILSQAVIGGHLYPRTAKEISEGVVPSNYGYPTGDVRRYGAVLSGLVNDTDALNDATIATAGTGIAVVIPHGTLLVTPATAQSGAASYNCACVMLSDTSYVGYNGATIKVSNNYSTDGSPKELAVFSTDEAIARVSFFGITFDMNGANNSMSPDRPVTYNAYNHAAIMANGPDGYINNCTIKDCRFMNNAGVCFVVCQLVAAGTTPIVGKTWIIQDNLFLNGGVDSRDHTSVYAFCQNVICDGNTFWQDDPPHTVGLTGGATGYEVHGSNQRVVNNYFFNYTLGLYVAPNFTEETINSVIANNNFYCSDYGILIWRQITTGVVYDELNGIHIDGNTFYFDDYTYSGQPLYKACVAYQGQLPTEQGAVNDVKITNNLAKNIGTTLQSSFVWWDTSVEPNEKGSNLSITGNQVNGFTFGVHIVTNADSGLGLTEISHNQFINLTPDSLANAPVGIYVNATGDGVDTLKIDSNSFTDDRGGSASFHTAINLTAGTITDLWLGPQLYKGLTTANFNNSGATITNQIGPAFEEGNNSVADGGTIAFNGNHAGLTPKSITCTPSVTGEFVSVTAVGATTFTVAIKKHDNTAGTTQTIYWRVKF